MPTAAKSCIYNWRVLDYALCLAFGLIAVIMTVVVPPHCRSFSFTDPTISAEIAGSTAFPIYGIIICVFAFPPLCIIGETMVRWSRFGKKKTLHYINAWIAVHAYSVLLQFLIVSLIKPFAGRLRPNFIGRLALEGITPETFGSFTHNQICKAAREGRLSFPSGYSGSAFAGLVPLSLYLLGLTRSLRGSSLARTSASIIFLFFPFVAGVSRTRDNDYHFSDILAGAVIGTACACFAVAMTFSPAENGEWVLRSERAVDFVSLLPNAHFPPQDASVRIGDSNANGETYAVDMRPS